MADLDLLRRVGEIDDTFPLTTGRSDEADTAAPPTQRGRDHPQNPGAGGLPIKPRDIYVPDLFVEALGAEPEESAAPPAGEAKGFRVTYVPE